MKRVCFVSDSQFALHRTPGGHPERPERLEYALDYLRRQTELWQALQHTASGVAAVEDILQVHTPEHYEHVRRVCVQGGGVLDEGDTHVVQESFAVALRAAGAVMVGVDAIMTKRSDAAFCAVRPPGHHAEKDRPMGFCLFNNVAVGARYAQRQYDLKHVAILDWDVHHGNGTQHIFEDDPTILYISLHQYPFYPGTGSKEERGTGRGKGFTVNIPLPAGTGEDRYCQAFAEEVLPALSAFKPELLIISAGFDAHMDDPLGGMVLTDKSFATFTDMVKDIAPVVSVLEGGYNLDALAKSIERHLRALMQDS